jgi:Transposase DDE domain
LISPSLAAGYVRAHVPKPLTSGSKAKGRFGKQDFVYLADDDVYRCPAGKTLTRRFTSVEDDMKLYVDWTTKCAGCPLKSRCTSSKQRSRLTIARLRRRLSWTHGAAHPALENQWQCADRIRNPGKDELAQTP